LALANKGSLIKHIKPGIVLYFQSCLTSGHAIEDHFVDVDQMVEIGSGRQRSKAAGRALLPKAAAPASAPPDPRCARHDCRAHPVLEGRRHRAATLRIRREQTSGVDQPGYPIGIRRTRRAGPVAPEVDTPRPSPMSSSPQAETRAEKLGSSLEVTPRGCFAISAIFYFMPFVITVLVIVGVPLVQTIAGP
jgi:hypothetical protein